MIQDPPKSQLLKINDCLLFHFQNSTSVRNRYRYFHSGIRYILLSPPGHRLKRDLRCFFYSKTFRTCWFPLYFIYRHFSRIALAIIWWWFFQHSLMQLKVSGVGCQVWKHRTEDRVLRFEVYRNRKGRKWSCQLMTENDPSSLCRASPRQATHGPRRTIHGVNRHVMLEGSSVS